MPAPEFGTSRKALIEVMRNNSITSREYEIAKAFLEVKNHGAMTRATWAVAFATVGLIAATVVSIVAALAR